MVIASDTIRFSLALAQEIKNNCEHAGKEIADRFNEVLTDDSRLIMMFPDGLAFNSDAFFSGMGNLKADLPFVGGTTGETLAFKKTFQFYQDQVLQNSVPCVLFSGDFQYEIGVSHGSIPVGITKTVTKAEGNHIFEIDHKPAFEIFREYLGESQQDLTATVINGVCLGVKSPGEVEKNYEDVILRIPLELDKTDGSIYMSAEWPEGTEIYICRRDPATIVRMAREVTEKIRTKNSKTPLAVFHFNCAGRSKALIGEETSKKEVAANQTNFDKNVPWLGWYTFGEIAPVNGKNYFHNWTGVLFVLYDN